MEHFPNRYIWDAVLEIYSTGHMNFYMLQRCLFSYIEQMLGTLNVYMTNFGRIEYISGNCWDNFYVHWNIYNM